MFWEFFRFEMLFRLKSASTYIYFVMWLAFAFFCVASESFGPVGAANGKVLLNGPYANSLNDLYASLFGIIVIAAIFGTSILRDFQRDTHQILFTKPIFKFAYLGGRWAGSMVTTVFAFSGLLAGTLLGTFAPWADQTRIGPNHPSWYLQPFASIVVVQIFFLGTLFFAVAALTRKIFVVYLQGVAFFMAYVIGVTVFSATRSLEHFWSGILDPVGLLMLDRITKYWSVAEKNSLLLPFDPSGYSPGVFLYNRLLWAAVGVAALTAVAVWFPVSVEALTARAQGKRAAKLREQQSEEARPARSRAAVRLPRVRQRFGGATAWRQFTSLANLRIRTIVREMPFWALIGLLIAFAANNGHFAGRIGGANVWPVTYLMLQAVEGSATLFFLIVAGLYAAELVWRERDNRFDGIHDALPVATATDWLSKLAAIAFVEMVLLTVTLLMGVLMQSLDGYTHYELTEYFEELYLITFPQVMGFALLALFVQTMVANKFIGHGIVIGVFVIQPVLFNFGWENTLYLPGAVPVYIYSDMNGYGHYAGSIGCAIAYWFSIFCFLGIVSIAFTRRGAEVGFRSRTRLAAARAAGLAVPACLFLLAAAGAGVWYYYNAHVLNEYLNAADRRHIQAGYERQFKQYEMLPQPKVTVVDVSVDIHPERRAFDGAGTYTLQNKTGTPIEQVHVTDSHDTVKGVVFDRAFDLVSSAPRDLYSIYRFDQPLAPGEVVRLSFSLEIDSHGFRDGNELAQLAANGTFFDSDFLPVIGYDSNLEIDDPRRRREERLGPLQDMAPRGDAVHSKINLFTPYSDWITYHTVVSTSDDQIAIAPGYLRKEWRREGRHYYEYSMESAHIANFYAYLSARYLIRKETYAGVRGPINLEVYYDPAHPYNIDEMLSASREGLAYFEKNFAPYQFDQFRIMEFPRYRTFAQSFANTVPFSESIGFITRVPDPKDLDLTYFVTAHELAHQWWGHQLIGARVEGSNMLSETLAQYSAYMVMQQHYGREYMRRVMHHFLDRYLRGRAGELRHERPLARVQRESYVWYEKGGQVLYSLADYIGEDKVNLALREFLMKYRYANATNQVDAADAVTGAASENRSYPDTRMLVEALRAQTPPELQYLIDDGFDKIVLYDNKVTSATAEKTADGRYRVVLNVEAHKSESDGNGVETAMPITDFIDIGVFSGKAGEEKPLYLKKEKMIQVAATYTIIVDQKPTRAGIDPYNKLIDRIADDNIMDVSTK